MALMSLRSRSRVKASMVLTRADHLFISKAAMDVVIVNNTFKSYMY